MTVDILTGFMLTAAIWSVLCRIHKMDPGVTHPLVFLQHAVLGLGLFAALMAPPPWGKAGLVMGVLLFLLASSKRWKLGAPAGTERTPTAAEVMHRGNWI